MTAASELLAQGARRRSGRRRALNAVMLGLAGLAAAIAIIPLIWIVAYVFVQGIQAISLEFFTSLPTPVGVPGGGIANAIVGSVITVGVGLLIAAPIGMLVGLYAAARGNTRLGFAIRFLTDTVAGVPSIVMGIFAYTIVVLPQGHFSALSGAVVLAFIMVPIIIRSTEEMLKLVPGSLREGSLALGAQEWRTAWRVMVPAALSGIVTGLMLAIARAGGEAAPMLFTAFGNPFMSVSLEDPIATLPHTVYVYAISPYEDWKAKAWGTALVLISIVLVLNIVARSVVGWRSRRMGGARR
jgi:phosphate transport system permease protein